MSDDGFLEEAMVHLDMVYTLARRLTRTQQEAEDLVQDTYLRAVQAWRRKRPDRAAPWLATICLNLSRSQHRKRSVRPDEMLDADVGRDIASSEDTEAIAVACIEREAVHRALALLSSEQREAVTLMSLCGFSASEAAGVLGVPRGTVLARTHRGHKRLARLLEEVTRRDS